MTKRPDVVEASYRRGVDQVTKDLHAMIEMAAFEGNPLVQWLIDQARGAAHRSAASICDEIREEYRTKYALA